MLKRRFSFLLLVVIGLAIFSYRLFNFNGQHDNHLLIKRDVGGHGHGYLYYDDGSRTRRVFIGYDTEIGVWDADLSPNASKIAFTQRSFLYIYDLRSNQLTQLNSEPLYPSGSTSIQWSPDGSQIGLPCSLVYGDPIEVCAWDIASGELQVLIDLQSYGNYDYLSFGGWSEDARAAAQSIAFTIFYPEDYDTGLGRQLILRLDPDDGDVSKVLDSQAVGLNVNDKIALSPDGKMILFTANTLPEQEEKGFWFSLYQINSDGTGLRRLVELDDWSLFQPVWSPDGRSFYVTALANHSMIPRRYDLSGRLLGIPLSQFGRMMLSWRSAEFGR